MANTCSLCGSKLSAIAAKEYHNFNCQSNAPVCHDCNALMAIVEQHAIRGKDGIARFSNSVDALKRRTAEGCGLPTIKSEVLALIDGINCGYPTFLEYQNDLLAKNFPESESHFFGTFFVVNQSARTFAIIKDGGELSQVHQFSELIDYNVTEDGASITSGRAGAAAVGALLGGVAGAVVGSSMSKKTEQLVSQLDIVLSFKGLDAPMEVIKLLKEEISKNSKLYVERVQLCNQIVSTLKQILDENDAGDSKAERGARAIYAFSVADEILKFRQLMDDGIITPAEFETQKQKLLSLEY